MLSSVLNFLRGPRKNTVVPIVAPKSVVMVVEDFSEKTVTFLYSNQETTTVSMRETSLDRVIE